MQFIVTARNSTRSYISGNRGYEGNRVCYLSIFHSYCKYGNQFNHAMLWRGTTWNQDSRGIRPRVVNRIHKAQGEPWGSSVAWVSSRKWYLCPYSYGQTKQRGSWTMLVKWTRKDCYLSRKDSGLGVSTNELMIWIRCVWLRWHRKHAVLGGLQERGWEPLHYST